MNQFEQLIKKKEAKITELQNTNRSLNETIQKIKSQITKSVSTGNNQELLDLMRELSLPIMLSNKKDKVQKPKLSFAQLKQKWAEEDSLTSK